MKTAVNTYSFAKARHEDGSEYTQIEMISCAKKMGFDAIEFVGLAGNEANPAEYAQKLKEVAARENLEISCYTVGADILKDGEEKKKWIRRLFWA